jgi:hypothetical protein
MNHFPHKYSLNTSIPCTAAAASSRKDNNFARGLLIVSKQKKWQNGCLQRPFG